jgi:peptidoglycan/xylan/chitin deacetylase (PgdA/CDA1 family)
MSSDYDYRREAREQRRRARARRGRRSRLAAAVLVLGGLAAGISIAATGGGHRRGAQATTPRTAGRVSTTAAHTRSESQPPLRLPAALPARTLSVPILMYHRIDVLRPSLPGITRRLTVDPADFAAQMRWLRAHGYHALTQLQLFAALERGAPLPARPILITFDDGYRDVFGKAMPILHRLHMHATAYVITSRISNGDPSFLTWGMLKGLERRGIEIGSHTVHHLELPYLSTAQATAELVDSRRVLEQHLGHPVQWFAYPAGAEDARAVELVRKAGYVLAVTTHPGSQQSAQAPLTLDRYEILDSTGVAGLAAILGA